jgi:hypothetical protein
METRFLQYKSNGTNILVCTGVLGIGGLIKARLEIWDSNTGQKESLKIH